MQNLLIMERGWQPSTADMSPNCPRCGSSNTKFCYYNNYSLTQPRYFCKGCRRYWTKGGNLRNVPVGGGCRKNRRSRLSTLRNNNNTRAADNDPPAGDSSTTHHDSANGSNIDLALVYANFLNNPLPESNKVISKSSDMVETQDNSIIPSHSNIQMLHQGTGNGGGIGFFGWDSLSELFVDSQLKVDESGFESSIKDISSGQIYDPMLHHGPDNNTGYFELPPLPGVGCQQTMEAAATWSDSGHQLLVDHSLAAMELLPVINGSADEEHLHLIGSNRKEF